MESSNLVTAPQIIGVSHHFKEWRKKYGGTLKSFLKFMAVPSPERKEYLDSVGFKIISRGNILCITIG